MNDSFWLAVNPAHKVASISASAWFFTVGVPARVDVPLTCKVPLNCAFPALLIVATVVSLAPPDPITTPPVPELFDPFSTTAPVPAALITVWLLVLPAGDISATALGAADWFDPEKLTAGCEVYDAP